jgi:glycosyltransferase involved in cell wall biosynthesis
LISNDIKLNTEKTISLSVVIPAYNEENNISKLHAEIVQICSDNEYAFEIIIVDDGSTDKTGQIARTLSPVKYIRLRRNFGQTSALDAGIKHSKFPFIVIMDGDLQNDPKDIPRLVNYLKDGNYDAVSGWRKHRRDNIVKKIVSRGANFLRSIIIKDNIHDSGCSLKLYRKECFENITLYGEMHRFIPALLKVKGFSVGELEVSHRPRISGKTKYNWKRTIKGFIDMIAIWFWHHFAVRPLHLLGGAGLAVLMVGFLFGLRTVYLFFIGRNLSNTMEPLLTAFLVITGIQLFVSGLLGDILVKTYYERSNDIPYSIKEVIENL